MNKAEKETARLPVRLERRVGHERRYEMKVARIHIDCCRECPYADKTRHPMIKKCTQQDEKEVRADEIDEGCPLDDETWEAE